MAAVKHARGVLLLLKVGDGATPENFTGICTINAARSLKGTANANKFNIVDCDDPTILAAVVNEKISVEYAVSGAGVLNTPDVTAMNAWLQNPLPKNCQMVVDVATADGGVIFEGAFHLIDFEITGDLGKKMEATVSLISDGYVTVVANTF